jgi:hypothetical protein
MVSIDEAPTDEFPVAGDQLDDGPGGLDNLAVSQRLPKYPGVTRANPNRNVR